MRFAFCLILMLPAVTYSAVLSAQSAKEQPFLASVNYCLSNSDVARHSTEAMAGSGEAATKLANAYWSCIAVRSQKKAKYWALIGAENGSAESQFRAYQTLRTSANPLDQERALFWLKKAAQQNYLSARANLQRCPSLSAKPSVGAPCFGPGSDH